MSVRLAERPVPGAPPPFDPPAIHESADGRVLWVPAPGQPFADVRLLWPAGWITDPSGQEGVAVLASRLVGEATADLDPHAFAVALERTGASVNAVAMTDAFVVETNALAASLVGALDLALETVARPRLDEPDVARARGQLLDAKHRRRSDPAARAREVLDRLVFGGHRLGTPADGTESTLAGLRRGDVVAFHGGHLPRGGATVVVVADPQLVDPEAVGRRVLGDAGAASSEPEVPPPPRDVSPRTVLVDRPGAVQSVLAVGHEAPRYGATDRTALDVGETLFGGTFSSRLNLTLREERGYTYGARARFRATRRSGLFAMETAVASDVTVPALRDIRHEVVRVLVDGPTQDEVDAARTYLLHRLPLQLEGVGGIADVVTRVVAYGLPADHLRRTREELRSVTRDEVEAALRRRLRPDELTTVVVGDAERLAPELEGAGIGPVEVLDN